MDAPVGRGIMMEPEDQRQSAGQTAHGQIPGVELQPTAQPDRYGQIHNGKHSHKDR